MEYILKKSRSLNAESFIWRGPTYSICKLNLASPIKPFALFGAKLSINSRHCVMAQICSKKDVG